MPNLSDIANQVPLMYRAQTEGRCQIQRLIPKAPEQDADRWADEWVDKVYPQAPTFGDGVQTRIYSISWRFITNSGQDGGVIRPVIGARGWPFYPGSSMKGLFRQAAKLIDGTGEFRPNSFRAAIRGHALRIFGGLARSDIAETLVQELFGGIQGGATVGLLSMAFRDTRLVLEEFGQGSYRQPTYTVEGELIWQLTRPNLPNDKKQALTKLGSAF